MTFLERVPTFFKRVIGLVILLAIALFVLLGVVNHYSKPQPAPDATKAPWAIQTSSRFYLGEQITMVGADPELKGYWTLEGNSYKYHPGVIQFSHLVYGDVQIIRRK